MQNNRGMRYSALLHGAMLFLLVFGLPSFLEHRPEPEPMAISVDILPIAPISNVKPQEKAPEKPEPKKPVDEQKTEKKATPEAKKEEVKKPDAVPLPTPVKKPEPKKPEKKEEKKPKKQEDDLDKILKSVKETAKTAESKKPTEKKSEPSNQKEAKSDRYDPAMPLSMSETDAIKQQFQKCWDVPAGAKDAHSLVVTLRVQLNQDGSVIKAELKGDTSRYNSDSFFRAAADSALRAVNRCSPLKNLPTGKYSTWSEMELTFDPKDMLF
jgi:outer membrane biosynthesis protein TonB